MDLKPFCNKCTTRKLDHLLVTSCRHIVCNSCYSKCKQNCVVCRTPCKVLRINKDLPEEMRMYFKPFLPVLKKYQKIVKFQLQQKSILTGKRKSVLKRVRKMKRNVSQKKQKFLELRNRYKREVERNAQLKKHLKQIRRTEPHNPFEMNSNRRRNLSASSSGGIHHNYQRQYQHSNQYVMGPPRICTPGSFNASSRSINSLRSNSSSFIGHSPLINITPRRQMSDTVDSTSFFNGSSISASSSYNNNNNMSMDSNCAISRTGQIRRLMQSTRIHSPYNKHY